MTIDCPSRLRLRYPVDNKVLCRHPRYNEGKIGKDSEVGHGDPNGSGNNGDPCFELCRYGGGGDSEDAVDDSMLQPKVHVNIDGDEDQVSYEDIVEKCAECKAQIVPFCNEECPQPFAAVSDCTQEIDGGNEAEESQRRFRFVRRKATGSLQSSET